MRRIVASLAAAFVVVAVTGWATSFNTHPHRLPVPPAGEALATQLPNGEPVFVVRHDEHDVSVLSAVSTHLNHVVAWCADSGVFIEPVGATRFDREGRWFGGPAPTGLGPYDTRLSADGRHVLVGRLQEPPARWQRPESPPGRSQACEGSEGSVGGLFPPGGHPDDAGDLSALAAVPLGRFTPVSGTIDLSRDPARLCAPAPDGRCPADAVRVRDFFWDRLEGISPRGWAASVTGQFLLRRVGARDVDRVAVLVGLEGTPPPYTYTTTWVAPEETVRHQSADYVGSVERVTVSGDEVVLHAADGFRAVGGLAGPPPPELPAVLERVPLRRRLGMVVDFRSSEPLGSGDLYLPPERLRRLVELAGEPLAVRFWHLPGTRLWSVNLYASLRDAENGH